MRSCSSTCRYRKLQNGTSVQLVLCAIKYNINIKIIIFNPEEQKVEHIKFTEPHAS